MLKRIFVPVVVLVALLLVSTPASAQGNANPQPIFTYVSEWGVPRAQWSDIAKADADNKAILDPLVANGTLLGYGYFENWEQSKAGYTPGSWFQAPSTTNVLNTRQTFTGNPRDT